jgi:hypothetical protein
MAEADSTVSVEEARTRRRLNAAVAVSALMLAGFCYFGWVAVGRAFVMHLRTDETVLDLLGSRFDLTWWSARETVGKRYDRIIPALALRVERDPSPVVRERAASCFRLIHKFQSGGRDQVITLGVPALESGLKDQCALVRVQCARSLWEILGDADPIVPVLREAWQSGDLPEKRAVMETVSEMEFHASPLKSMFQASLADPVPLVRRWASDALFAIMGEGDEER